MEDSAGLGTVRYLKTLVTAMTVTTILGLIVLITVVVMKFSQATPPPSALPLSLPEQITLPEGVSAEAVTMGQGWIAVVSGDEILIYNSANGTLQKRISIR